MILAENSIDGLCFFQGYAMLGEIKPGHGIKIAGFGICDKIGGVLGGGGVESV